MPTRPPFRQKKKTSFLVSYPSVEALEIKYYVFKVSEHHRSCFCARKPGNGTTIEPILMRKLILEQYPDINWKAGKLLNDSSKADMEAWVKSNK